MATRGRPNPLANPDYAQQVAEALAAGCTRQEICDMFGVKDKDTITRWKRDPRVKNRVLKISEDRVIQVTRKVDSTIAARLENAENMTTKELLEIRKEFLGGALRAQTERADDATVTEAADALENNPNLVEELEKLFQAAEKKPQEQPDLEYADGESPEEAQARNAATKAARGPDKLG